jgi:hypothetical protein
MSYHRKEVDKFLDYDSLKVNSTIDTKTMTNDKVEVELQFSDSFDPSDKIIAETKFEVEFNEEGKLETNDIELVNNDPEFFMAVLQAKYDRDGEGEKVDLSASYDTMFMEAVGGRVSEDIEHDIQKIMRMDMEEPEIEVDDIEIEMEEHEFDFTGTLNPKDAFRQAFIVNGEQVAFTYEVDSGVDENSIVQGAVLGQDVEGNEPNYSVYAPDYVEENGYSEDKLYEIFEGLSETEKDNKVFELKSKIDEMALDNYKEKVSELEEPKQEKKQEKNKGFGMSM